VLGSNEGPAIPITSRISDSANTRNIAKIRMEHVAIDRALLQQFLAKKFGQ
jgi:hypothetical protein